MAGGLFGQFLSISWRQAGKTAPTHQAAIVQDPPSGSQLNPGSPTFDWDSSRMHLGPGNMVSGIGVECAQA
jgi:hypothetical protein